MPRPARLGPWVPVGGLCALLLTASCAAPPPVPRGTAALQGGPSLRGLHAAPDGTVWAGGSNGTVARSRDHGRSWEQLAPPPGGEELDFRDVHAFSAQEAVLMAAGTGEASRLFRTDDAGRTWTETWRNRDPAGFLDGIDFWPDGTGLAVGDPLEGRLMLLRSEDRGVSWQPLPQQSCPLATTGEYAFAASGTSLYCGPGGRVWIGTGGSATRILRSEDRGANWVAVAVPFLSGPGAGVFSVAFADERNGVAVGGDYLLPEQARGHAAWSDDGGRTWHPVAAGEGPRGYRSCVVRLRDGSWLAVGPTGSDRSQDDGRSWQPVGGEGWHAATAATVSGGGGRLGTLR